MARLTLKQNFLREEQIKGKVPIGSVIAWLKSFTGTPSLPSSVFVECNGQLISDSESPFDGQTIPDLNGAASEPTVNYFLRGNTTSGGTGGEDKHTLTITEMPAHTHTFPLYAAAGPSGTGIETWPNSFGTITIDNTGSGNSHENKPPYYDVVWIMRIR